MSINLKNEDAYITKMLHKVTPETKLEMENFSLDARAEKRLLLDLYDVAHSSYDVCACFGRPRSKIGIFLMHANEEFTECVQAVHTAFYTINVQ